MKVIALLLILFPVFVQGQTIYKCKGPKGIVFSQTPCSGDAEKIELKSPGAISGSLKQRTSMKDAGDKLYRSNRLSDIKREISDYNDDIERYQAQMDLDMARLKHSMVYSTNSLAGATRDQQLATQMQGIVSKYQSKIDMANRSIDRLIAEKEGIMKVDVP